MLCIPLSVIQSIKIHVKILISGFNDGKKFRVFQEFGNIHLWGKKKYDTYFIFILALVARKLEIFFIFCFACVQECSLVRMGVFVLYLAPLRVCKPPLKSFSADAWGHFAYWICLRSCSLAFPFGFGDKPTEEIFYFWYLTTLLSIHPRNPQIYDREEDKGAGRGHISSLDTNKITFVHGH